ncbi:hypothetical protein TMES_14160 [Thalassospira mesophila]|uniref:HTH araC/xylS-type domain-containing protein n=1 Tax=Thalassospira mesophila TaxID=1293891 RepID=A0A1Y2KY49_9PROT|nr:hypothetical protein TMES_14160 [Thalassospira mesophila]
MRYDVWRESISCIFNVDTSKDLRDPRRFNAVIKALRVGNLMLAETTTVAQTWQRRPLEIARDGLDHFMIQLFVRGKMSWTTPYGEEAAGPGDLVVFDLAREMQSRTSDFNHLSLIIPRDRLGPMLDHPDYHHMQRLPSSMPLARLLGDYILLLNRNLPSLDNPLATDLLPAVISMVASCLNAMGPPGRVGDGPMGDELAETRIRSFIRENLGDTGLDVNGICDGCGISRSALYRLFREEGGVRHFLREQRLVKAMRELLFFPQHQISMIARINGFSHANDFSRAFRRRFGLTPRDLRASKARYSEKWRAGSGQPNREYEEWLRQIGQIGSANHNDGAHAKSPPW